MPVFLKFDAHDKLRVPLAAPDDQAISAWVERKLLEFLDTYLRLDRGQEDFEQDAVVDPVCGMRITRETAQTTTQYRGHPYYFCSEDCRSRFVAEPPRYIRFETG
ncbi:MAG: YHS domain-containing protein [Planctomycetia bacterium]|nr:YHS domain-containing protein [Planctomycetia bacterium]